MQSSNIPPFISISQHNIMELHGSSCGIFRTSASVYLFICILCTSALNKCASQRVPPIPSISISQTKLTARVNGTVELSCEVTSTYVSSTGFQWQHIDANGIVHLYDVSSSAPRVTVSEDSSTPTYSLLTIENLIFEDSGQIRCVYFFSSGRGSKTVSYDVWLCVSDIPKTSPRCSNYFDSDNVILQCISTQNCPNDVTLEWRKLSTLNMYIGFSTRNVSHAENELTLQRRDLNEDEEFICKFSSDLYPDVSLNCTISAYEIPTMVPPSSTKTATAIQEVSTMLPTTFKQIPETFSQTSIIIVACAFGIGILLFIGCCVIFVCRRKRKRSKDKPAPANEASYTELDITNIKDTTYTELKPKETTSAETGQRDVDDSTEDHGVYVNDWRVNQIQKQKKL